MLELCQNGSNYAKNNARCQKGFYYARKHNYANSGNIASTCRSHKICTRVNGEKCGLRHTLLIHYLSVCPSSPFWLCHNYFLFSKILPPKIF